MTDKQFIETLKNIQNYCSNKKCADCKFNNINYGCVLFQLARELYKRPYDWDIEEIERILKEYD